MFKGIKRYLYKKGYLRLDTLYKKILYLVKYKDNINFYSPNYRNSMLDFLEKDIVIYNRQLDNVIRQGLETRYVTVRDISQNSYTYTSFSFWYSDNGKIIENNQELDRFLHQITIFVKWYEDSIKDMTNTTLLNNTRRLKPYYTNIETIVNNILKTEGLILR